MLNIHRFSDKLKLERYFRLPRRFSNCELKKFAPLFGGRVINVLYTGAAGGPPAQPQACGAIVGQCMP